VIKILGTIFLAFIPLYRPEWQNYLGQSKDRVAESNTARVSLAAFNGRSLCTTVSQLVVVVEHMNTGIPIYCNCSPTNQLIICVNQLSFTDK
jgi:hypothetical protein